MVYDVTKYLNDHPGGPEIMMEFAGNFVVITDGNFFVITEGHLPNII